MVDDLLKWRKEFPELDEYVHLVSHSLGAMPRRVEDSLRTFTQLWREHSIEAWETWVPEIDKFSTSISSLLGAPKNTVTVHQNVSVVQSVLASCFDYSTKKNKIVYSSLNFPSVSYIWQAQEKHGAQIHVVKSDDDISIDVEAMCDAIDETTIAVPISHVFFRSSYIQDVKTIAAKANAVGAHVILDCYQSLGTVPVDVIDFDVSFACGGSIKWLCGGPGAAYLYVKQELIDMFEPAMTGWFAHQAPFAFSMPKQEYSQGIWRYLGGTPSIIALYQACVGVDIVNQIGTEAIRAKSLRQTKYILDLTQERGFKLRCFEKSDRRGGTVVFDFDNAESISQELNKRKFYCDYRPQAGIRISPHFYTKDEEIDQFFEEIDNIRKL